MIVHCKTDPGSARKGARQIVVSGAAKDKAAKDLCVHGRQAFFCMECETFKMQTQGFAQRKARFKADYEAMLNVHEAEIVGGL